MTTAQLTDFEQQVEDQLRPGWPLLVVRCVENGVEKMGLLVAGGGPTVFRGTLDQAYALGAEPELLVAGSWAQAFRMRFRFTDYGSWDALAEAGWTPWA